MCVSEYAVDSTPRKSFYAGSKKKTNPNPKDNRTMTWIGKHGTGLNVEWRRSMSNNFYNCNINEERKFQMKMN